MDERSEREQLKRTREKLRVTRETLNFVAQDTFAAEAARFIRAGDRLASHPALSRAFDEGVLYPHVFSQKSAALLALYGRLAPVVPEGAILEIGVKNGGSVALWRHLFPSAKVIGVDVNLAKAVRHPEAIYLEGDQTDQQLLAAIVREHGPFALVVDDGSHVGTDQITTLKALLPSLVAGGIYVIEDIHAALKLAAEVDYGLDVWPDYVRTMLDCLRGFAPVVDIPSVGEAAALLTAQSIAELSIARNSLILTKRPDQAQAAVAHSELSLAV